MKCILTVLCLLFTGFVPSVYAEDAVLDLILKGPYTFQLSAGKAVANIPVRTAKDLRIEKLTAFFGSLDTLAVSRAISASIEPSQGTIHPHLKITLSPPSIPGDKRHGTYHVVLDVSYPVEQEKEDEDGKKTKQIVRKRKFIPLDIVYPETKFYAPQPILIRDTWVLGFHWNTESSPLSLEVREGPLLDDLSAVQAGAAKVSNDPVVGQLRFDKPEYTGRIARVSMGIRETFPIGNAGGTIQISAPGMERTDVTFTVKTRQHKALIIIIAAIGLIMGFLLRTRMEASIEGRQNKLQLQRLLLQVKNANGLGTDAELEDTLVKLELNIQQLDRELKTGTSESFPAKLTELQEELKNALAAFANKKNRLTQSASDRDALLRGDWQVPPGAKPKGDLSEVRAALNESNLDTAQNKLADFDKELKRNVTGALEAWCKAVNRYLPELGALAPPLPESTKTMLASELLTIAVTSAADATDDFTIVKTQLVKADQDYQRVANLLESLQNDVFRVAGRVHLLLRGKAGSKTLETLEAARQELVRATPEHAVNEPNNGFTEMAGMFQRVTTSMYKAIEKTHEGNLPDDDKAMLDAGQYEKAARQAPVPGQLGVIAAESIPEIPVAPRSPLQPSPVVKGDPVQLQAPPEVERVEAQIQQTWRQIAVSKALQSIGAGLGLTLVAYLIFADSFVGTPADFIKVFFWGFTTDIGVNVLLEKATSASSK